MIFRNSLANFVGQLILPVISIVLVPFYISYLGLEGYGLVGFFSMLVTLLGVFTKGLGSALQREFARRDQVQNLRSTTVRLLRTFEIMYWGFGALIGTVLFLFSGLVNGAWLNLTSISTETVRTCLFLISFSIAIAFPQSVYQAVFIGMQRQVTGNTLQSTSAVVQAVFAAAIVWLWRSVVGFYVVSAVMAILQLILARRLAYRIVQIHVQAERPGFSWEELKQLWKISTELIWTNGIGLVITQFDRIVISWLLPVASLGIYNIGVQGGRLLDSFYAPFLTATYPQTCQLALKEDLSQLGNHLMRSAKVMLIICLSLGLPLSFFASEVLSVWARNEDVVRMGSAVLSVYAFGYILLSNASVFYQGLTAFGETRYGVKFNGFALIWYPVLMWFLISRLGLVGAAWAWLCYCFFGLSFNAWIIFSKIIKHGFWKIYVRVVVYTSLSGSLLILVFRWLADILYHDEVWGRIAVAGLSGILIAGVSYLICFGFSVPDELKAIFET